MAHHPSEETRLFPSPVELVHCHLQWGAAEGWTVVVSHRHEGQPEILRCHPDRYGRLTWTEAFGTAEASVLALLPHLEV